MTRQSLRKRRRSQSKHESSRYPSSRESGLPRRVTSDRRGSQLYEKRREEVVYPTPKVRMKVINYVLTFLFYVFTIGILSGAVLFTLSKDNDKAFFGYRFYTVLTNSMLPRNPEKQKGGFAAGDIIIVEMVKPESVKVNDIITFNLMSNEPKSTAVLTHRLIEISDGYDGQEGLYFKTQGDANTGSDRPFPAELLIGKKVFAIPKVGQTIGFLRENMLVSMGVLVAIFALIISLRYYFSYSPEVDPLGPPKTRR